MLIPIHTLNNSHDIFLINYSVQFHTFQMRKMNLPGIMYPIQLYRSNT